jgi:hypothetical protein
MLIIASAWQTFREFVNEVTLVPVALVVAAGAPCAWVRAVPAAECRITLP